MHRSTARHIVAFIAIKYVQGEVTWTESRKLLWLAFGDRYHRAATRFLLHCTDVLINRESRA